MREVKSYKDLAVWQKAMDLVIICYRISSQLPKTEIYGLSSQIRRAAVSIPANIAEGKVRNHIGDYIRHLSIANVSLKELETHLLIVNRLSYLEIKHIEPALKLSDEVGRMLNSLIDKLAERKNLNNRKTTNFDKKPNT